VLVGERAADAAVLDDEIFAAANRGRSRVW
jgi:hypothetical protein